MHITILVTHNFKIGDRRRKVATVLAQSMTEMGIAPVLKPDPKYIIL
jgi:hypothetical protein